MSYAAGSGSSSSATSTGGAWQPPARRVSWRGSSTTCSRLRALTINRARDVLGVTHRAATLNVEKLADAGIVSELQSGGRQRVFLAVDILGARRSLTPRATAGPTATFAISRRGAARMTAGVPTWPR
jgi:hypothetical protein